MCDEESKAFAATYQGKLSTLLSGREASAALHEAIARYERLDEVMGRLMSYVGSSTPATRATPSRAKLYGDTQERTTTAGTHVLFFQLELNQLDDEALAKAAAEAPLSHYRPWLEDIRREKPHQLEDKLERLFLEKSVSGAAAWNRLFDETMAALRFEVDGEELTLEPTLNKLQDTDAGVRKRAAEALAKVFKENLRDLLAHHQHARQGQGHFRPLARLQGRGRRAPSVEPRRAGSGGSAGRGRARRLSAPVASLLSAQGELVRRRGARLLGSQRALAEGREPHHPLGRGEAHGAFRL